MCERLGQLREALGRYASSFDPSLLSCEQAAGALAEAAAIEKSLEGWGLVEGRGKRAFVPPGDPRHPACCPAQSGAA